MKYTGIAETSAALTELLIKHMVPEPIKRRDQIVLCNPSGKESCRVGIWLYDIEESRELGNHAMIPIDETRRKYPPSYINLFYMITAYSNGDGKYQAAEEQYLLGKIIQVLKDNAVLEDFSDGGGPVCSVSLQNLPIEDKLRIFHAPDHIYKTSLFYEVGPIEIESKKEERFTRVSDIQYRINEQ